MKYLQYCLVIFRKCKLKNTATLIYSKDCCLPNRKLRFRTTSTAPGSLGSCFLLRNVVTIPSRNLEIRESKKRKKKVPSDVLSPSHILMGKRNFEVIVRLFSVYVVSDQQVINSRCTVIVLVGHLCLNKIHANMCNN